MDEVINLSTTLSVILQLGRVGENNANSITFDFSDWQSEFGEGTVSLVCKRPTDAEGYPVSLTVSGTEATWLVSSTDVAYEGLGQAQISYTVNGVIKKSVIYMTRTCPSIEPVSSTPPDPYASWLDQMIEAKEDAEAARDEAVEVAGDLTEMAKTFPALLVTGSSSGSIATFDDGSETPVKSLSVNIDPVQAGSGDPSPENVRNISGWDGLNVYVTGKNLLRPDKTQSTVTTQVNLGSKFSSISDNEIKKHNIFLKAGTYIFTGESQKKANWYLRSESGQGAHAYSTEKPSILFTIDSDSYVRVWVYLTNGISVDDISWFQLELGSVATSYEPYQGTVYPISLPQTVYGGVLDVKNGTLTVTKKMMTFNGSETWMLSGKNAYVTVNDMEKIFDYTNAISCDKLKTSSENSSSMPNYSISGYRDSTGGYPNQNWIYIRLASDAETVDAIKAWLAENPITVVYPLATPLTLSLTPTEVRTILGYNNIYADSGNVDVVYYRDLDIVINRLLEGSNS